MINIKSLTKTFLSNNQKVEIFKNLNFEINSGEFIAIIGPSGSGKSTFLNLLSGIDREYEGEIFLDGQNIKNLDDNSMTEFRGKNISYIFQNFKLLDNLTSKENIDLIIDINNLKRNFETIDILKKVGLESKKDTYVYNLSGGESQRIAIARAFVGNTKILLADEPTGALDQKNKQNIMDSIISLHKETKNTIVMITHDDEVAKQADKIYKLQDNNLVLIK